MPRVDLTLAPFKIRDYHAQLRSREGGGAEPVRCYVREGQQEVWTVTLADGRRVRWTLWQRQGWCPEVRP